MTKLQKEVVLAEETGVHNIMKIVVSGAVSFQYGIIIVSLSNLLGGYDEAFTV